MSAVDVLAVLDWFAYPEARPEIGTVARATKGKSIDDLRQARAAVAELIEADKEYDEARDACDGTRNTSAFTECWNRLVRAKARRAAALANIGAAS